MGKSFFNRKQRFYKLLIFPPSYSYQFIQELQRFKKARGSVSIVSGSVRFEKARGSVRYFYQFENVHKLLPLELKDTKVWWEEMLTLKMTLNRAN